MLIQGVIISIFENAINLLIYEFHEIHDALNYPKLFTRLIDAS